MNANLLAGCVALHARAADRWDSVYTLVFRQLSQYGVKRQVRWPVLHGIVEPGMEVVVI